MSAPADPTSDAIAAALAPGMSLQEAAVRLATGVCAAYAAYNNGSNFAPSLAGYHALYPIQVYESCPCMALSFAAERQAHGLGSAPEAAGSQEIVRQPAAYAPGPDGASSPCTGTAPLGTPQAGYQLFGFTATADDGSHNILVLRGTVTNEEAAYDLIGWGTNTACLLPSQSTQPRAFGLVNAALYDLYTSTSAGLSTVRSLAASCQNAIKATSRDAPNLPWYFGGHSLGGAMLSLAALDGVVSGLIPRTALAMTFGSLHVGDAAFATAYKNNGPTSVRVANLCDFVPSMVSLEPVIPTDPYVHVGTEATFVWQTWDDWANHSLANIYLPVVQNAWNVIQFGKRNYPQ